MSAAFLASQRGFPEILLELCEAKASPEAVDLSGARLLDVTIQEGHLELVKLLVACGAELTASNRLGRTDEMIQRKL
ncbi:Serine/threonine-protein phosphatase 6 regulatory ankyrin repeat subunit C-like [Durusdinium trenchii]|uniref:Serine/threonine-protein phosphatase 6 regulatory ankyrin repeat subunit C-like n=1 Tax=Durusdinium trenchii TaxID=1381693 RepID=A0ABP0KVK2_9DINO